MALMTLYFARRSRLFFFFWAASCADSLAPVPPMMRLAPLETSSPLLLEGFEIEVPKYCQHPRYSHGRHNEVPPSLAECPLQLPVTCIAIMGHPQQYLGSHHGSGKLLRHLLANTVPWLRIARWPM